MRWPMPPKRLILCSKSCSTLSGQNNCYDAAKTQGRAASVRALFISAFHPGGFLLNLHTCANTHVVLMRAVEEGRQVVNLNGANVDVLAGVYVKPAAESHGKSGVSFLRR